MNLPDSLVCVSQEDSEADAAGPNVCVYLRAALPGGVESRADGGALSPPKEFKVWRSNAEFPPETYSPPEKKPPPPPALDTAIKRSSVYENNGADAPRPPGKARFLPVEEREALESDGEKDDEPVSTKKHKLDSGQQTKKKL
ncbi:UPF0690 protein C1orf52 homolog [Colius striatus]|uniref:UPF0690 protein C1orf52 homolog n=1 Tax=Colius striatus TaxID=57412 RepID=UPI002B1D462C|nr:UPF0690 protein C1orf52 homolog [Colius striatus]XP_061859828.1 UPF0690 protein C1orf52 homolog [Colius striatus]